MSRAFLLFFFSLKAQKVIKRKGLEISLKILLIANKASSHTIQKPFILVLLFFKKRHLQVLALLSASLSCANPLKTRTTNSCSFFVPFCHEAVKRIPTSDTDPPWMSRCAFIYVI